MIPTGAVAQSFPEGVPFILRRIYSRICCEYWRRAWRLLPPESRWRYCWDGSLPPAAAAVLQLLRLAPPPLSALAQRCA